MKKVLAVVVAAALVCFGAIGASAQIPNVQVYFDEYLTQTQADCPPYPGGPLIRDTCYVGANNFEMLMATIEYSVSFPFSMLPAAEHVWPCDAIAEPGNPECGISLGTASGSGITITWPIPRNAFGPVLTLAIEFDWRCNECFGLTPPNDPIINDPIVVNAHQDTGELMAIEYDTFEKTFAVGMRSLVCPEGVRTEPTSWGRVKALYE